MRDYFKKPRMKNIFFLIFICQIQLIFGQNVIFNNVAKVHENKDKFLYKIDSITPETEYLAEIEIQGFSNEDVLVFNEIYKKAKEVGANGFAHQPFRTIEGTLQELDPNRYKLRFYYLPKEKFPKRENVVYIIASPTQDQKITFNKEKIEFQPRTFIKRNLQQGATYLISTRKILGSSVKISAQKNQIAQYYQLSAFKVSSNLGSGGINLKSGDITLLERSYAEFLTTIYKEIK